MDRHDPFFVEAGGHRLCVRPIGTPASPDAATLVFLHEGLGSIGQWRGFPNALCEATGLPGLIYERWGYGASDRLVLPRPTEYLRIEAEAALADLLNACAVARPILIGHSDGGSIALLYAAAHPDRPAACISIAGHVFVEDETLDGIRGVVNRWENGALKAPLARYHGDNTETMFRGWAEVWLSPAFRDWNIEDRLPAITCPMLLIQGEHDEHGTLAQVEAIMRGVAGPVETCIVPGCGHSPHLEAPEAVVGCVAAFIAALR